VFNLAGSMKKVLSAVFALLLANGAASQVFTAVNANEVAVNQLAAILDTTTTLTAEVEQLLMDQDGRELQENRVELVMQKPASFYWAIKEPYEELMVTDGSVIWRYEPDLEQVTIQEFNDDVDRTPVMLLNGNAASIAESYEVSATSMDSTRTRFVLLPKKPGNLFERLSLTFKGSDLEEMQFEDSLGQQTSLTFRQVVRNQTIDSSKFHFTPPDGVEVIDNTEQ
jgi:outer membrane lipoprotein carrier protein